MSVQKRGMERRKQILLTTRALLKDCDLAEITLADVAKESGVPVSSIYHFYPSILEIYRSLVDVFREELAGFLVSHFQIAGQSLKIDSWQQLVGYLIDGTAQFYRDNYEFQQLILSGKAPAMVKQLDRENDSVLAELMSEAFNTYFSLPDMPNLPDVVFNAVEMVDLFFSLSVYRNHCISDDGVEESKRAVSSYLRCYLPEYLTQNNELLKAKVSAC